MKALPSKSLPGALHADVAGCTFPVDREVNPEIPVNWRIWFVLMAVMVAVVAVFFLPAIPQSEAYHNFADKRPFLGIPNCLNVVSNVLFLLVGTLGIRAVLHSSGRKESHPSSAAIPIPERPTSGSAEFIDSRERWPYFTFFVGVASTAFGSAYYHLNPGDATLLWDRIPMAIGFMALVAATVSERINVRIAVRLLIPLLTLGAGSVVYWDFTEKSGHGDLRPYGLVQFGSLLVLLLMLGLFPPRYTRGSDLTAALAIYAIAKIFEAADRPIFALSGIVSGHTLKHIAAATSTYWILRMLRLRAVIHFRPQ